MMNTDFIALSTDESASIEGGSWGFMAILAGTALLVAKECITHYQAFENGVIAGYHDAGG